MNAENPYHSLISLDIELDFPQNMNIEDVG